MKILHLAAGNRWTGAAAPAFAEVEALRAAGVDAHFAYVGGYKLETKLAGHSFAHPIIDRAQNPVSFLRTVKAIRKLVSELGIDILHAHLTWDHLLARVAARGSRVVVARTFHSRRTLRRDVFTSWLVKGTGPLFVINETFLGSPVLRGRGVYTPPPLDSRLFNPVGPNVRSTYSIDPSTKVIAVIGKLSPGRGFEAALRAFALVHEVNAAAKLLIIGHGEHRPALEALAAELSIDPHVIWAGYHEDDLPQHYRAADALLFTAAGSDEGHRAVLEALGCGLPVASYPIAGVESLLGPLAGQWMAGEATPEALAAVVVKAIARAPEKNRPAAVARSAQFTLDRAAQRLIDGYPFG
ncbi:MAG TPA: glycosyltransferase family 4 protein [Thermoanaerobaculia bacterium]|nr:glycosyltransferase family 4 protein [Thermoanaerobaculia bacterium]